MTPLRIEEPMALTVDIGQINCAEYSQPLRHNGTTAMNPIVEKLIETWPKRARVRKGYELPEAEWESNRPDYPAKLLPFYEHPIFDGIGEEKRCEVLTLAWLAFNHGAISTEEIVVNPALLMISQATLRGVDDVSLRVAVQQMLVDEHFHTLMHTRVMAVTRRKRGYVRADLQFPDPGPYKRLLMLKEQHADKVERDILGLAWAIVAEIRIPFYLGQLSDNTDIQPLHQAVAYLHNRDELAHSSIFSGIFKLLHTRMTTREKELFNRYLPEALKAFSSQDYSVWRLILEEVGVAGREEMLRDCARNPASKLPGHDTSGVRDLVLELNIQNKIDYEFA